MLWDMGTQKPRNYENLLPVKLTMTYGTNWTYLYRNDSAAFRDPYYIIVSNLNVIGQYALRYWGFSTFSPSNFKRAPNLGSQVKLRGPEFGEDIWPSLSLIEFVLDFKHFAPFRIEAGSNASEWKIVTKFGIFVPPCKLGLMPGRDFVET